MQNICRQLPLFCALALLIAGLAQPAAAQRLFTVSGVDVSARAGTATDARAAALAKAQQEAIDALVDRLVAQEDQSLLILPEGDALDRLVQGIELSDEVTAPGRYAATVTITFDGLGIRRLFSDAGVRFTESPSAPYLLVPLYEKGGLLYLWEKDNPWARAWQDGQPENRLMSYRFGDGGIRDRATLSAYQAKALDEDTLAGASARHGADGAIVAHARLISSDEGSRIVYEAQVRPLLLEGVSGTVQVEPRPDNKDDPSGEYAALEAAAREIMSRLDRRWKERTLFGAGDTQTVAVQVPIQGMEDWLNVLKRLEATNAVRDVTIVQLGLSEGRLQVEYVGNDTQLALALGQNRLQLDRIGEQLFLRTAELARRQRQEAVESAPVQQSPEGEGDGPPDTNGSPTERMRPAGIPKDSQTPSVDEGSTEP